MVDASRLLLGMGGMMLRIKITYWLLRLSDMTVRDAWRYAGNLVDDPDYWEDADARTIVEIEMSYWEDD